ncbi:MAG: hypothetical protein VB118_00020 [Oscillospiraceae bacterium]|nr:hypothetical protein [Oscillospiraceae bacterium]
MPLKINRLSSNPKKYSIHARLDDETQNILTEFCKQEKITITEGIRAGIMKLKDDIKK